MCSAAHTPTHVNSHSQFEPLLVFVPSSQCWAVLTWSRVAKAGEQNEGPLKLAPDAKTLAGPSPEQAHLCTPTACNPLQCLHRGRRYLFISFLDAKMAPKSLIVFDLTGDHAAHCSASTAACLQPCGWTDKCTSSNYMHSTVWCFIFTVTSNTDYLNLEIL